MHRTTLLLSTLLLATAPYAPRPGAPPDRAALPIREVTAFKDGHAFVVHRGRAATDGDGNVVLDELPRPVLGTFWAYSADEHAALRAVAAGPRKVSVERAALDLRSLIEANPGADVIVDEGGHSYSARIEGIPKQPGEGLEPATIGDAVWLRTADGVRVVSIAKITELTFKGDFRKALAREEVQPRLTLRLDWRGAAPAPTAEVGMMYVQKGLRWIPSYRLTLDGRGQVAVELQGTLINELADLENVTANMVVGVPRFAFDHTLDPMALQQAAAALSPYFQQGSQTAQALSNAIMAQSARMGEVRAGGAPGDDAGPGAGPDLASARAEDLFVFTVEGVTLARGERMVLPVASFKISYEDVYKLDIPAAPPREAWQHFGNRPQSELQALLAAPKVMHALRLRNDSKYPLTTAPALLLRDGRVLAQSMLTYTAAGATTDVDLTTAVDVRVTKSEDEAGRAPDAATWRNERFMRIDLTGRIALQSFGAVRLRVEVARHVLGAADEASHDGRTVQRSAFEVEPHEVGGGERPAWWGWWSWPWWWHHFNGISRITWDVTLEPGKAIDLTYRWHYYWQ